MGRVLKHNVFVSDNPPAGNLVALLAGQEVPEWAEEQLKGSDHLFVEAEDPYKIEGTTLKPDFPKEETKKSTSASDSEEVKNEELKVPSKRASQATWLKFAKAANISNIPNDTSRDEIIERVLEEIPDLFEEK